MGAAPRVWNGIFFTDDDDYDDIKEDPKSEN